MMQNQPTSKNQRYIWPALALVAGAALGLLIALAFALETPAIAIAIGAGLGLIAGAIIDLAKTNE